MLGVGFHDRRTAVGKRCSFDVDIDGGDLVRRLDERGEYQLQHVRLGGNPAQMEVTAEDDHGAGGCGHCGRRRGQVVEVRGVEKVRLTASFFERQHREMGEPDIDARDRIGCGQPATAHVERLRPAVGLPHDLVYGEPRACGFKDFQRGRFRRPGQRREHVARSARAHLVLQSDAGGQHVVVAAQQNRRAIAGRDRVDHVAHRGSVAEVREVAEHCDDIHAVQQWVSEGNVEPLVGVGKPIGVVPTRILNALKREMRIGNDTDPKNAHK